MSIEDHAQEGVKLAEEGVKLAEEELGTIAGGKDGLHSFTCPACGEQVYFYDNDRPYSCPHCGMHC